MNTNEVMTDIVNLELATGLAKQTSDDLYKRRQELRQKYEITDGLSLEEGMAIRLAEIMLKEFKNDNQG